MNVQQDQSYDGMPELFIILYQKLAHKKETSTEKHHMNIV